ncbi:sigma factor-like helix-turn-helix DNA-binding protein, partial [Salmonella enterica]|nr:sigma factor-like helix-turn-helix DNA-binding protein [Salmonella enterica]
RQKVRNTWVTLFSNLRDERDGEDADLLEALESEPGSQAAESSADRFERVQTMRIIEEEVRRLPTRQREAFLLRYWEDMDVAETAA